MAVSGDAQEQARAFGDFQIILIRSQNDDAGGISPAGVNNADVMQPVDTAGIGGKYPEGLWVIVAVDGAATICPWASSELAQDAAINTLADNII